MQGLIDFIDQYMLDEQVYFKVNKAYDNLSVEIQWLRDNEPHWQYRTVGTDTWVRCSSAELVISLNLAKVDLIGFESQLRTKVLETTVFCHTILKQATDILGKNAIEEAIENHEAFLHQLRDTIRALTNQPPASEKLPDTASDDINTTQTHLKLL